MPDQDRRSESESLALLHQKLDVFIGDFREFKSEMKQEIFGEGRIKDTVQKTCWEISDLKSHRNRLYVFVSGAGIAAVGAWISHLFKTH
jgi:hypothetical protein